MCAYKNREIKKYTTQKKMPLTWGAFVRFLGFPPYVHTLDLDPSTVHGMMKSLLTSAFHNYLWLLVFFDVKCTVLQYTVS
jgi:hypothetical protein